MGKRRVVIVSSSEGDEEEGEEASGMSSKSRSRLRSRSRSRAKPVSRKKPKGRTNSSSRSVEGSSRGVEEVNFDMLSKDFVECLNGFRAVPGWKDLWVEKYKPRSLEELAVHKKKVEEVRLWLEERIQNSKVIPKEKPCNHTLLVSGQAGIGKSAAIHVIASQLGAELCEWRTPTPTLWQEHLHNSNSGMRYMSKLDEFETFIEQIRKYPLLQSISEKGSRKPVILLIDDLPVTNGRVAYGRLSKCLHSLAYSTRVPTVILMTEYYKDESGDSPACYWEELEALLVRAGAYKVSFNPLTANSIKKTLSQICREENQKVSMECIDQIAQASGGDIRHAITSLQYFCLRPDPLLALPTSTDMQSEGKSDEPGALSFSTVNVYNHLDGTFSMSFGKDETLTLFHALGKFLHNKREIGDASNQGPDSFNLQERYRRLPLKMDAPERVLCQAHGQARPIADFLHENVLDFLRDEAVDDAWMVASYLSDADYLLASSIYKTRSRMLTGKFELENMSELVAASVAVRGVLFGNSQPSPSRWHSIRSPKLWQVEQLSRRNKNQMTTERFEASSSFTLRGIVDVATEYRPITRTWSAFSGAAHLHETRLQCCEVEEDIGDACKSGNCYSEEEEDQIEDW